MSSVTVKAPKTGLASAMRAWMAAQTAPFCVAELCDGLGTPSGNSRQIVRNALGDFVDRGEIMRCRLDKRIRRQVSKYRYNPEWQRKRKGTLNATILKAMYVTGQFAVTDIQRLTDLKRDWIDRIVTSLKKAGYIRKVGRRLCAHGAGAENLYHIVNRDRYRLEVMR